MAASCEISPKVFDVLIIGAGPIGLACGIEAKKRNLNYLIIEKGCIVNSIFNYPINMNFFSTPDLLEIGGVPFITHGEKSSRQETVEYYRRISHDFGLNVQTYEQVTNVTKNEETFLVESSKGMYEARKVITAIGFFDRPRMMDVPGEELEKVSHYYREAHPYYNQDLLVVGSGNSAVEAALECYRNGARVSMAIRSPDFHGGIKYWVRPDIENRIKNNEISTFFETEISNIGEKKVTLNSKEKGEIEIKNDFVLALTGYQPDFQFLKKIGVGLQSDRYSTPVLNQETWESKISGLYLAGVVVGGMYTNKWFIENSREHAQNIFSHLDSFV